MLITIIIRPKNTHGLNTIVKIDPTISPAVSENFGRDVMPFLSIICDRKLVSTVNKINGMNLVMKSVSV